MEILKEYAHQFKNTENTEEVAIFDLIGELLAVSLENHNVEVVIESKNFLIDQGNRLGTIGIVKTTIDCEDIVESDDKLEITISGVVENSLNQRETFTLFFSLVWNGLVDSLWKSSHGTGFSTNALYLKFAKKAEQLSDSVFSVNLCRRESDEYQYQLGHGRGFLVFGRELTSKAN